MRNPFGGTLLDGLEELTDFEARIKRVRPALVFIDTCLNATERTSHKPEDAKAFFVPLAQIAARTQAALVCLTHLNADGKPFGQRIVGQGRVVITMETPDPEGQPNRRKLYVIKSHSLHPPALGATTGDTGNDYDDQPPAAAQAETPRRAIAEAKIQQAADWLKDCLASGPERVLHARNDAEAKGIANGTLYRAVERLGIEQFETEGKK